MKVVYPLGMLVLVGAVFLAFGSPSASARPGEATPAETHANAMPRATTPPIAAPTNAATPVHIVPSPIMIVPQAIDGQTGPIAVPEPNAGAVRPIGFDQPVGLPSFPQPIDPLPSFQPIKPITPMPLATFDVA